MCNNKILAILDKVCHSMPFNTALLHNNSVICIRLLTQNFEMDAGTSSLAC